MCAEFVVVMKISKSSQNQLCDVQPTTEILLLCYINCVLTADMQPTPVLQCYCVAFLLNLKDWDFLSGLGNMRFSGFIQVKF